MNAEGLAAMLLGTTLASKKQSVFKPFIKTLQIAEEQQAAALHKLSVATEELKLELEGRQLVKELTMPAGQLKLTEHFALEEFIVSQIASRRGIANTPDAPALENLRKTAAVMEKVRSMLGNKPIIISSGFRSPALNVAVGGSTSSAHMYGLAVDFVCPGFGPPLEICKFLQPHMELLGIDQLIHEFSSWVHLGLAADRPRHQALTIDVNGTRPGFA